jgi:DNA-binding CsgD family transcriptional regulator
LHLLSKRLVSSEQPKESESSSPSPGIGAFARSSVLAAILDGDDRFVMANDQASALLSQLFGPAEGATAALDTLSLSFRAHARTLRRALETSDVPILQLTPHLFCRGCLLGNGAHAYLLVLFEPAGRRNMAQHTLDACGLTPREHEVAELVLEGLTNRTIADRLTLAEYTVETHVKRILTKVDVPTRSALVAKILGLGAG